jgi:hypothetical protein
LSAKGQLPTVRILGKRLVPAGSIEALLNPKRATF